MASLLIGLFNCLMSLSLTPALIYLYDTMNAPVDSYAVFVSYLSGSGSFYKFLPKGVVEHEEITQVFNS